MDPLGVVRGPLVLPDMYKVRQHFDVRRIDDLKEAVWAGLSEAGVETRIRPGMSVAVTAGSRGVRNIVSILRNVVSWLEAHGTRPFVIGAMGSHGGGTAEGQMEMLRSLGITEESVGCPVRTSDLVSLVGMTPDGHRVYCDTLAFESDGIVLVNRVKPHTSFRGPIESGVTKMMAVGLGKAAGATYVHRLGAAEMAKAIFAMGDVFRKSGKVLGALAVLENAFDETARITGLAPDAILEKEPELLKRAIEMMPSLPADDIDLLIVNEMGKNYSGTGMDTNILGRFGLASLPDPETPRIKRVVALDLSDESHGNATGLSLADVITTRITSKYDRKATYLNCLTSTFLFRASIPPAMDNDWAAIGLAVATLGALDEPLRVMIIKNTLHLDTLFVSESLLSEVRRRPYTEVLSGPVQIRFGPDHNIAAPVLA